MTNFKLPLRTRIKLGFYMFMCDVGDAILHPIKFWSRKFRGNR